MSVSMIGPSQNAVRMLSSDNLRMIELHSTGFGAGIAWRGDGWSGSWKIGMVGGGRW